MWYYSGDHYWYYRNHQFGMQLCMSMHSIVQKKSMFEFPRQWDMNMSGSDWVSILRTTGRLAGRVPTGCHCMSQNRCIDSPIYLLQCITDYCCRGMLRTLSQAGSIPTGRHCMSEHRSTDSPQCRKCCKAMSGHHCILLADILMDQHNRSRTVGSRRPVCR